MKVATVMQVIEKLAPKNLAYDWDNIGLIVGSPMEEIEKILVSLDVTEQVVNEAIENDAHMIICHHPLIFKPISKMRWDNQLGAILKKLIQNEINLYVAHTNLDLCKNGVNQVLFEKLSLENGQIIKEEIIEKLFKLVAFVPVSHLECVKNAMSNAGAGWIGGYSHCSFATQGIGTFKPLEGTNPYKGKPGEIEEVEEIRLETIVREKILNTVLNALLKAHPYEEVAYDIYPLANSGQKYGLGMAGEYKIPIARNEFFKMVKERLHAPVLKVAGIIPEKVQKVGVCGGSGGSIISKAAFKGVQVFITGDVSYHQAQEAEGLGICVIDAGHGTTEKFIVPSFAGELKSQLDLQKNTAEVIISKVNSEPWVFL